MWLLTFLAFFLGVVIALSPVLEMVLPSALSLKKGQNEKRSPFAITFGLIISFVAFNWLLASLIQKAGLSIKAYRYSAVLLIGFLGFVLLLPTLNLLFARLIHRLAKGMRVFQKPFKNLPTFGLEFIFGAIIGMVWAPIMGPLLFALIHLFFADPNLVQIVWLAFAYSLGASIPFFLLTSQKSLEMLPILQFYSILLQKGVAWLLIITAVLLAFNLDKVFEQKAEKEVPEIQIENNRWLNRKLDPLRQPEPDFPNQDNNPFSR